ncbi:ABC transporter ATP-binding protein [Paenibacillus antri]|uniref:ABC transporter ATP-binding protein n=1 Tax=Paenibacillus antri TaxID=2582848 RepID=A0A5R9G124_9BACL|nr:ABC transporter ATP-binding protein [Paenibacillus antri]TLS49491.1 ABC transporter ATP-binding protein [Paenibacillus antri]
MGDMIRARGVTRVFGRGGSAVHALRGVDLTVPAGKLVALRGRSGSGKTTLINLLGTLDRPTDGMIELDGVDTTRLTDRQRDELRRTRIGLIFQSYALVPYMSGLENVEFGLRLSGVTPSASRDLAEKALSLVGLKKRMHHRPFELSGGEQQRVAVARAIAHRPKLVLADEPTAELDSRTGLSIVGLFRELVENEGLSIVMTTHDPAMMEIVDHVYALEDGVIV